MSAIYVLILVSSIAATLIVSALALAPLALQLVQLVSPLSIKRRNGDTCFSLAEIALHWLGIMFQHARNLHCCWFDSEPSSGQHVPLLPLFKFARSHARLFSAPDFPSLIDIS